jgi:hypothetical protein
MGLRRRALFPLESVKHFPALNGVRQKKRRRV